mmetsp:Transcript_39501/g.79765  ORF Transcript_39501/g.79765 Transcript_39501/m.79765 type:complete len:273 (-) Transcript_39501:39-857(-)
MVVGHGNSSGRFGPCLGLWIRNPSKLGATTVLHGLCSTITPPSLATQRVASAAGGVGDCASPTAVCYTTAAPTTSAALSTSSTPTPAPFDGGGDNGVGSHVFVVGYDDGSLAVYDDRTSFSKCKPSAGSVALSPSSPSFVVPLRVLRPHGNQAVRCLAPFALTAGDFTSHEEARHFVLSGAEDCRAVVTQVTGGEQKGCGDGSGGGAEGAPTEVVVDGREDYVLAVATIRVSSASSTTGEGKGGDSSSRLAVLTGGMDGQVRMAEMTAALGW